MSGKLISDLQRQIRDLERYIGHLEGGGEMVTLSLTIGGDSVSFSEPWNEFDDVARMFSAAMLRLGCEGEWLRDIYAHEREMQIAALKEKYR